MHNIQETENLKFDAEVGKVLNIVIHSLYTNKDIFLRELISNASDACDKLRYESQLNPNLLDLSDELKITISSNKDKNELYITDNGIGMNRQDLIDNLGTIASSGTQKFLDAIKNSKDSSQAVELIGKFGVGFYSSFMVASEVIVESRKAGEEESWVWQSKGDGEYSISKLDNQISRGTKITLIMHPEENGFLHKFRVENIVTTYSDHINFPVEFIDEEGKSEKLNSKAAIWTKPKNDVTQEEHNDFFRSVAHVGGEPWMILHNKNEGAIEYTNLLYVPSIKPFDLFHPDRRCSVKLYVNKVFITEDNVQIIPQYLRFLKGIVDSPDLPLNISRETLQNNRVVEQIRKSLTKRVISELGKKAKENLEEYTKFWTNFGAVLKEGLCEAMPTDEREALLSICRFHSTGDEKLVSIDEYKVYGDKGSYGEATYTGKKTITIEERRRIIAARRVDPLAQTFTRNESRHIGGVELWFVNKGKKRVVVQIRETAVGMPSQTVIAESYIEPKDIKVDGTATRIEWPPVFCHAGQEYAIVLLTDDPCTEIKVAELGKYDAVNSRWVTSQPYQVGVLLSSSNASTWTPHQNLDLTFRLLAAKFSESSHVIDLGKVTATNTSDLIVLTNVEKVAFDTNVEFILIDEEGKENFLSDNLPLALRERLSGELTVKANLKGSKERVLFSILGYS